ncbi:MAG TPA: hypothetical protein VHC43_01980 [Mycobacteriales bacterium]|nr:hypothetical protein [Mycobacteriales bacterium]
MQAVEPRSEQDLRATLRRAHDQADKLLADPEGSRLEVVAWLSAHIAAFEHSIYPAVRHQAANGPSLVEADRQVVARLARTLRMIERRHSGDVLAGGLSADRLGERVSNLVAEHREVLARILGALEASLSPEAMAKLAASYDDALAHAPTRPHPHLHSGVMFRVDALWDRILDTMDGRHIPLPRVRRSRIMPGRWGAYLLGQQQEPQDGPASADQRLGQAPPPSENTQR